MRTSTIERILSHRGGANSAPQNLEILGNTDPFLHAHVRAR